MYHYYCIERFTGEEFLVSANNLREAYKVANLVGAFFSCGCDEGPDVYVEPQPLSEFEAEASGLDEY